MDRVGMWEHLHASDRHPAGVTREPGDRDDRFADLSYAYEQMAKAQENGELGWVFYLCEK